MKGMVLSRIKWVTISISYLLCALIVPSTTSCPVLWSYSINGITALSVSENGNYIAVGCQDGYYYLFDTWGNLTGSGQVAYAVDSLDIANTGRLLVGFATGYTFCTKDGTHVSNFRGALVKSVSMSSEGTISVVCSEKNIFINQEDSMTQQLHLGEGFPFGVMSSGGSLACAASGRYLYLYADDMFHDPLDLEEDIEHLFVSAEGNIVTFSTHEEIGYIDIDIDIDTEQLEPTLYDLESSVTNMAVSSDGGITLVSTADRLIWLKERAVLNELPVHGHIQCISLSEDGSLAVIGKNSTIQIIKSGVPVFTYDLGGHIVASEISGNYLVVCTDNSVYTFQLFKETENNNKFSPLSSRKSLPLTSPLEEIWSAPVAKDAGFLTADFDGDGLTEILLCEGTVLKLLDGNGNQESTNNFVEEPSCYPPLDFDGDTICEIPIVYESDGLIFSIYDWKRGFTKTYDLESLRDTPSPEGAVIPFTILDDDGKRRILATVYVDYSCKPRGVVSIDYVSGNIEWFYQMGPCVRPHVVTDIDGNGATDIILGSMAPCNCPYDEEFPDCEIYVTALSGTGEELWKIYLGEGFRRVSICAADVDECEGTEIIGFAYEASEIWGKLFVLNCFGKYLYDFEVEYSIFPGAVVDIDDDGYKEIVTIDSRGYISVFTSDLQLKSEKFIKGSIIGISPIYVNDLDGDGFCEIILGVEKELYILDKNLEIMWKKEFDDKIRFSVANFDRCKNTLFVISDKLYAFSYEDTEGSPCPLWEITERELLEEGTAHMDTAESSFAAGEYRTSRMYFERALATYSQLEDQKMIDFVSKRITEVSTVIFKYTVKMGTIFLAVLDGGLCVAILYYWIIRKRWYRLAEGTLLLSLPVFLGLFQVYYAANQYIWIFVMYFIPSFVFSVAVFLRQKILGFTRTILALRSGHKDMLVLSIGRSDGSYRVSVESIEEKFRPVKESREITFSKETRNDIVKKVEYMMEVLKKVPSEDHALGYAEELLRKTGSEIYENVVPEDFSDILKTKFLLLEVDDTEIPWELMYADDFFSLKYGISRRIVSTESVTIRHKEKRGRRALIISDPRENLPDARTECKIVYKRLTQKMETILVEGSDANVGKIAHQLGQGFDIIHYAGHIDNGLLLSGGVMSPKEVKEYIIGTPVVFVNGCKSEELARAFLLGGAMAYVGTIHPVHDSSAAGIAADFYDLCLQHQIGEALRKAREYNMGKNLVWASLVMYGDPTLKLL